MPMHDWTRVDHGSYHDFHQSWANAIRGALNRGLLPSGYEAKVEQHTDDGIPDVLALRVKPPANGNGAGDRAPSGLATATLAPPKVSFTSEFVTDPYTRLRRTIAVRHDTDLVALIELVSPGNKSGRHAFSAFVRKVVGAIDHGVHVLLIDPFPPGPRDPNGLHGVIWPEFRDEPFELPAARPLTLAAYAAGPTCRAYVEPIAVGDALPEMPLFLQPNEYLNVPLEATYATAFADIAPSTRAALS